jgi:hypothetical protein
LVAALPRQVLLFEKVVVAAKQGPLCSFVKNRDFGVEGVRVYADVSEEVVVCARVIFAILHAKRNDLDLPLRRDGRP